MSGECDKCSEHAVDCDCDKIKASMSEWISTRVRKPKEKESVGWVFCDGQIRSDIKFHSYSQCWFTPSKQGNKMVGPVTHWMPLPEPPESIS